MFIRILWSSASTCWLTVLSSVVAQILCSLRPIEGVVFSFTHVFFTISFFFGCPGYKVSENRDVAWFQVPLRISAEGSLEFMSFMGHTGCFKVSHHWTSDPPITTTSCSHQSIFASNRYSRKSIEPFAKEVVLGKINEAGLTSTFFTHEGYLLLFSCLQSLDARWCLVLLWILREFC